MRRSRPLLPFALVACALVACGEQPQVDGELAPASAGSDTPIVAAAPTPPRTAHLVPTAGKVLSILADLSVRAREDWYDDEFQCVVGDRLVKKVTRDDRALRVSVTAKVPTGIELEFELQPTEIGPPTVAVVARYYTDVPGGAGFQNADVTWGVVYVTTSNVLRVPLEMKFQLLIDKGGKRVPLSGGLVVRAK